MTPVWSKAWSATRRAPLWAWLLVLGVILTIRFPVKVLRDATPFLMDYAVFHGVATRVLGGQMLALYDPVTSPLMMFKYAPCWAIVFAPLGWFTPHAGAAAWCALIVLWTLGVVWLSHRLCQAAGWGPHPALSVAAVLLVVRPLISEFSLGQTNQLWALLIAALLLDQTRHRPWRAGLWLALAISLKVPALIFLLYLCIRRSWATAWRALVWLTGINAAASVVLLPAQPLRLLRLWLQVLRATGPDRAFEIGNQSMLSMMGRLLRADGYGLNLLTLSDAGVGWVTMAAGLLLFAMVACPRARRVTDIERTVLDGGMLTVLMVILSPTCWDATYSALLLPVTLALGALAGSRVALRHRLPAACRRRGTSAPAGMVPARCPAAACLLVSAALSVMLKASFWRSIGLRQYHGETYVYLVFMILPLFGLAIAAALWLERRALDRHRDSTA